MSDGVIRGDRADVLFRRQKEVRETMARIIRAHHAGEKLDNQHAWIDGAVGELFGYLERVIRHQAADGGRPGNGGRGR